MTDEKFGKNPGHLSQSAGSSNNRCGAGATSSETVSLFSIIDSDITTFPDLKYQHLQI